MPSPRIKVDHHIAAGRQRLTAQHIARCQFVGFEAVVGGHRHFAAHHFAFAGGADAAFAGERQVGALSQRGIENAVIFRRERNQTLATVLTQRYRAPFGLYAGGAFNAGPRRIETLEVNGFSGIPSARSVVSASSIIADGPQIKASSKRLKSSRCSDSARSLSPSMRPCNRSLSIDSG